MQFYEKVSFVVFVGFWCLIYISELFIFISKLRRKERFQSRFFKIIRAFSIIGIVCLCYAYFIEPYWVDVHHVSIQTNKLQNTSFTVVQISDLHCDKKIRNELKIVKLILIC